MSSKSPISITELSAMKSRGERISMLTVYDYSFAHILDEAGVEILLVGDSLGMVIQGHPTTLPVRLDDVVYHTQCVSRGCKNALVIADMPFGSFQGSPQSAFDSAARLMGEGNAQMVKIEGGAVMVETVAFLVDRGIPVCGHLGLTPQSVNQFGGFRVQGREEWAAEQLRKDARILRDAGASVLILEAVPSGLARDITRSVDVPIVGIGAGPDTDGQILVLYDVLGIYPKKSPKFSKNYLEGTGSVAGAVSAFVEDVRSGQFPGPEHSF
jgi:3-methyl-2-oxobutanoate hydroxymethyltransferase